MDGWIDRLIDSIVQRAGAQAEQGGVDVGGDVGTVLHPIQDHSFQHRHHTGREVVQERRPNKRVFAITDRGRAALREFIAGPSRPSFIRDDLLVKVHAAEAGDVEALVLELEERAAQAGARADLINSQLARLRGEQTEEQFLADSPRIGPYLTGMRGRQFETENAAQPRLAGGCVSGWRGGSGAGRGACPKPDV